MTGNEAADRIRHGKKTKPKPPRGPKPRRPRGAEVDPRLLRPDGKGHA